MLSFIRAIITALWPPKPRLSCPPTLWASLQSELCRRGGAVRESGAFLLGQIDPAGLRRIEAFLPYDDIDPKALRGAIVFDGSRMDEVWRICRARGLQVVADVHTHPGRSYAQSRIDQAHPMMPERGHLALILPNFADRIYAPGQFGIYEFQGRDGWIDHSRDGPRFMKIEGR